jgi:hypothetical protein
MINPAQIQQKAESRYSAFLTSIFTGESFFPIEIPIGSRPKEYLDLKKAVTQLIDKSKQTLGYGYLLELESKKTQKHGQQSLPKRISIETQQDYLKLINKEKEFSQFEDNLELIRGQLPELHDWLCQHPLKVIEYSNRWSDLIKVCKYFQKYPKPNLYIRELPIQVHTKFIEQNKGIIRNLLDAILPSEIIGTEEKNTFETRFHLKYCEPLIRLRILDLNLKIQYSFPVSDISTPISEFRKLNLIKHPFLITENLMNFLTLPPLKNCFALFGSGYAIQSLKSIEWLTSCPIFYWGDLDTDGFNILSQLRSYFPQTESVMMDRKTFETFQEFAVSVPSSTIENLPNLTSEEYALYTHLHNKRLEQERISQNFVEICLQDLIEINCNT